MRNIFKAAVVSIIAVMPIMLQGQVNTDGSMPQYHFDKFNVGEVVMTNGKSQSMQLNYNIITGSMVFIRGGQYYDLVNPELVDTIKLNNCKFIPDRKVFHEVLFSGPVDLFADYKGNLQLPSKQVGYGGTSELAATDNISSIQNSTGFYNLPLPSDMAVKTSTVFWIRKGNDMFDFLNEKQFLKIFPDKEAQLKSYIKGNKLKFNNNADLIKLVKYCITLQ
jgi:hypothetical protein